MSDKTGPIEDAGELDELALLLCDPQVREFLSHYLAIADAEGRAYLRCVAANLALNAHAGDAKRRRDLGLSPRAARQNAVKI